MLPITTTSTTLITRSAPICFYFAGEKPKPKRAGQSLKTSKTKEPAACSGVNVRTNNAGGSEVAKRNSFVIADKRLEVKQTAARRTNLKTTLKSDNNRRSYAAPKNTNRKEEKKR